MGGTYVTELTNRRNAKRGNTPSIYDGCVKALEKLGVHSLATHDFDVTFDWEDGFHAEGEVDRCAVPPCMSGAGSA
ncbi:hypothetical protein B0H13DRAFT_2302655 [Mycena leptocephala]|nr:hypothetical protein B0H13DRAFT_2302655 [Mycena leptocephala]